MSFQDHITWTPIDNFQGYFVIVFNLISMQDATGNFHYPQLVGEPLRLELNFAFPLDHVFELNVLGERISLVAVGKIGVVGKIIWTG